MLCKFRDFLAGAGSALQAWWMGQFFAPDQCFDYKRRTHFQLNLAFSRLFSGK